MTEHRFAVATVLATLVLLVAGGLVVGTGSSLACPDWPTCYGSFSPEMSGGVEYEHTHRVIATLVGMLTLTLALLLWRRRADDLRLMWLGVAASLLVIFQGVLGGVTVLLRLPTAVSAAHLATAMVFLMLVTVIATRSRLLAGHALATARDEGAARVMGWATLAVYLQVALGGVVRHTGAGLACTDLPWCAGDPWPSEQHVTALVHMIHRYGGVLVSLWVLAAAWRAARGAERGSLAWWLGALASVLVIVQFCLGLVNVLTRLDLVAVTTHLGVGATLLAVMTAAWQAHRLGYSGAQAPSGAVAPGGEA